jgi:hypothetical protein
MRFFNYTRGPLLTVKLVSILLVSLSSIHTAYGQYPENTDLGTQGEFLWKEGTRFGRTANLTTIGPYLMNMPEAPGSSTVGLGDTYSHSDTIWDLSDLTAPVLVHNFNEAAQPFLAHATIVRFGNNGARLLSRHHDVGYDPSGSTLAEQLILDPGGTASNGFEFEAGNYSHMTSNYTVRNYWSYGLNRDGVFGIHDPKRLLDQPADGGYIYDSGPILDMFGYPLGTWTGVPYVYWDHFAVANVTGFTSFHGNLMVMASDQQNTGMAIYDVSGLKSGRVPRLLSVFQPELTEPSGNITSVGGYWSEPYGATKIVWAARGTTIRNYPAFYIVDFEDPRNPILTCEIYFNQDNVSNGWGGFLQGPDDTNGDASSDPMYVNFQDNYAYVDHFKVDITACEAAMAEGNAITGAIFDEVVYKFDDAANECDSSNYFRPLGQLGVFGGYDWGDTPERNEQGMCGFVTSDTPDTNAPYISGHRPLVGQTDVPTDTFVHIHIPETLRTETVENSVTITNTTTSVAIPYDYILSHTGTISIFPDANFAANTTYRVDVAGIRDYMGNTMVPYSYTFVTDDGDLLRGEAPFPEWDYVNMPAPATITLDTGTPPPLTGPAPTYAGQGYFPNQSSPIVCPTDTETGDVWVVNPDNDSISIISSNMGADMVKTHQLESEIRLLYEAPTSVTRVNDYYAVTYRDDDKIVFLNSNGELIYALDTGHGTQPIASVGDGNYLYVALYGSGEVIKINTADRIILSRLAVGAKPKAMALHQNRLLVTRFISPSDRGHVYDVNTDNNMSLSRIFTINKITVGDDIDNGGGVPNYLSSIVISSNGEVAYVTATKANTDRGLRPNSTNPQPLDGDNTVRPMIAILDLVNNRDSNLDPSTRSNSLDLDNGADPSAITFLPNPAVRVTALQGNDILLFANSEVNSTAQFNTGGAPQGMCSTRRTLYVKNFTGRSISAIDISSYLDSGDLQQTSEEISTVTNEVLTAEEKAGLDIFYLSSMPEMGVEGYMTCASCHAGGGHDGRVWDNTSFGEGLRNTISLNGSSGTRFGPLHWSSNFDEVQDFELQLETLNGGTGLIPGQTFSGESPLDMITTGQSIDLDALAAYVSGLGKDTVKRSPSRTYTGQLSAEALRGQALFSSSDLGGASCASCHSGPAFRDGQSHDMGTLTMNSGNRLNGSLTEIRTPTLIELWDSAPYFHDGSAATLGDVLSRGTHTRNYNGTQMQDLVEYLRSIDRELYIDDDANFDGVGSP